MMCVPVRHPTVDQIELFDILFKIINFINS